MKRQEKKAKLCCIYGQGQQSRDERLTCERGLSVCNLERAQAEKELSPATGDVTKAKWQFDSGEKSRNKSPYLEIHEENN